LGKPLRVSELGTPTSNKVLGGKKYGGSSSGATNRRNFARGSLTTPNSGGKKRVPYWGGPKDGPQAGGDPLGGN